MPEILHPIGGGKAGFRAVVCRRTSGSKGSSRRFSAGRFSRHARRARQAPRRRWQGLCLLQTHHGSQQAPDRFHLRRGAPGRSVGPGSRVVARRQGGLLRHRNRRWHGSRAIGAPARPVDPAGGRNRHRTGCISSPAGRYRPGHGWHELLQSRRNAFRGNAGSRLPPEDDWRRMLRRTM